MKLLFHLLSSVRMRCPHCRRSRLARHYFAFRERCGTCGYVFQGESGDFWGTVVILYTIAGTLGIATGAVLIGWGVGTLTAQIYAATLVAAGGALLCFPFAKSLWIHLLYRTRGHFEEYRPPEDFRPGAGG